jgi:hypothetical protein
MRFEDDELDDIVAYHGWFAIVQMDDGRLYYKASDDGSERGSDGSMSGDTVVLNTKWSPVTWTHVIEALQL